MLLLQVPGADEELPEQMATTFAEDIAMVREIEPTRTLHTLCKCSTFQPV